jgi:hypothetical protein
MGDIYAAAQQVLICLSTKEDQGGGMAWLMQYGSDALTHYGPVVSQHEDIFQLNRPNLRGEDLERGLQSFKRTILRSPWWSRAWVRQELMRSPIAYFLASYESLDFLSVSTAVDICWRQILHREGHSDFQLHVPHDERAVVSSQSCQACIFHGSWSEDIFRVETATNLLQMKARSDSSLSKLPHFLNT